MHGTTNPKFITLYLLNCVTEIILATEGRRYFPQGPQVGQPYYTLSSKSNSNGWLLCLNLVGGRLCDYSCHCIRRGNEHVNGMMRSYTWTGKTVSVILGTRSFRNWSLCIFW